MSSILSFSSAVAVIFVVSSSNSTGCLVGLETQPRCDALVDL